MKQNLKFPLFASFIKILFVTILTVMFTYELTKPQDVLAVGDVDNNIETLLTNYSLDLSTGETSHSSFYSNSMGTLVTDRKDYYSRFFKTGLYSNLTSLKSEFYIEDATITTNATTNTQHIEVLEVVTMLGHPIIKQAKDYSMILAAHWAISKTKDANVKQALKRYIKSTSDAVNNSLSNGVKIDFRIHHNIDVKGGQLISDTFTDKEFDNGDGYDNMGWINGVPRRSKPDLTKMPDYIIYNTSIRILGQQLLNDYTKAYGQELSQESIRETSFAYSRAGASAYARSYTSNATKKCNGTFADTSKYSKLPYYQSVWQYTIQSCNDCANYISQSLRAGRFPVNSTWNYTSNGGKGTYTWRTFDWGGLAHYLFYQKKAVASFSSYTSLQLADLMYTNDSDLHIVMVTNLSPFGFSGHTNDRYNYPYASVLKKFWHVKDIVP